MFVPPPTVIVLTAPVPAAVTFVPTKLRVVAAVAKEVPSSCTVIALAVAERTLVVELILRPVPTLIPPRAVADAVGNV